ncbi:Ino80 complex subunit Ies2 [Schizosaccharomyces pombe]
MARRRSTRRALVETPSDLNAQDSDSLSVSTKEELGDDALAAEEGQSVLDEQEIEEALEEDDTNYEEDIIDDEESAQVDEEELEEEEEEDATPEPVVTSKKNSRSKPKNGGASKRKASRRTVVDEDSENLEGDEEDGSFSDLKDLYSNPMPAQTTPVSMRMTKRQRAIQGILEEGEEDELLELPPETSGRKKLTPEEMALRRIENARRRKNQSERRLEEEKMETINRLLKRQSNTGKPRRGRAPNNPTSDSISRSKAVPKDRINMYQPFQCVRFKSTKEGSSLGVPEPLIRFFS